MSLLGLFSLIIWSELLFVNNGITNNEVHDHSFMIHLYENYVEIDIKLTTTYLSELQYSAIVTKEDCINKYKFISLDLLINTIKQAIDDDIDETIASYKIKVIKDDKLELIIAFNDGTTDKTKKFILNHLEKPLSQETKLMSHLQQQVYDLKKKNKILKSMIVPKNGIIIWPKCNDIPNGYVLCDGDNDTLDLRHLFIVNNDEIIDDKACNDDGVCQSDVVQKYDVDNTYYDMCYIMKK